MPPRRRSRNRRSNAAALIDRFVPENTPLGRLDEGNVLLRAAGGNEGVAKFLALLARKESSFGAAGRLPKGNNYWGWGIHLGPDVNSAPSVEAMAARVAKGLMGRLYKGAGLTSTDAIINRYAPPSENNTALYQSQIRDWSRQLGLNPSANIFAQGSSSAMSAGNPVSASDPGGSPSSLSPGSLPQLSSIDRRALVALLNKTMQGALQGQMPGPEYARGLNKLAQTMRASVKQAAPQGQAAPTPGDPVRTAQSGVPQGAGIYTTPYGGWAGTEGPIQALTKLSGLSVSSAKRARRNTVSGSMSDHYQGNSTAFAHDLSATPGTRGDSAASRIVEALGGPKGWGRKGGVFNTTINGIRFQVLWKTMTGGNHYDHIHVGARRT